MVSSSASSAKSSQKSIYRLVLLIALACVFGSALVTGVVYVGLRFVLQLTPSVDFKAESFDSTKWKALPAEFSWDSHRLRMVDDLLKRHPLVGEKREAIIMLIGEPDKTEYFKRFDMVYFLGKERHPFGVDSEWLVIKLDEGGRATEVKIATD